MALKAERPWRPGGQKAWECWRPGDLKALEANNVCEDSSLTRESSPHGAQGCRPPVEP